MADSVIQAVTGKFVEYSVDVLKKQVNYLCFYSSNVQTLADELEELNNKYEAEHQRVVAAEADYDVITPGAKAWFKKAEEVKRRNGEIHRDIEAIRRSSVRKWLPLLQYPLNRKICKAARDCVELRNFNLDTISNPIVPADMSPVHPTSYVAFESHKVIEDRIMQALEDPNVYLIGIWGIGGVGKTEMAKNIERKVREKKTLFDHVVLVPVPKQQDEPELQRRIAEAIKLELDKLPLNYRQRKLHHRLNAGKRFLIILDGVWKILELEALGIPFEKENCKLILTSQDKDVLASTGVRNIFQLEILTGEESWRFFRNIADINDDDSRNELLEIARKVERECNGLPLALKPFALGLKGKPKYFWENALEELKKDVPENIPGVLSGVYQPLKCSFEMLESKQQKYLFLLCCLFPENLIPIEDLLRWEIGLRFFKDLKDSTAVRNKVRSVLDNLFSRSLLTEKIGYSENFVKVRMHDVFHRVGVWIANEEGMVVSNGERQQFMIKHGLNECPLMTNEDSPNINSCTFISLQFSHPCITFPKSGKSIVYPKLKFLRLDVVQSIPMVHNVELPENFFNGMGSLTVLEALSIGLLPPSIGELISLRTLFLQECNIFQTISMFGKLINLEILILRNCEYDMLPIEIGGLKGLKQLNILNCSLKRIAFGVISGLTRLEELSLAKFTNIRYLAEGRQEGAIFPRLEFLDIYDSDSLQQISDVSSPIGSFEGLQNINLNNLSGLICLWKVSIKEELYLKNLQSINISRCDNLSYLFSLSVVQSLVQLSKLWVSSCKTMKEIFKKDDGESIEINKIKLPKLSSLEFWDLESFYHFCDEIDRIELPQLDHLILSNLPRMKMTKGDNNEVHQEYLIRKVSWMNFNFCGLTYLEVEGIGNFKCMFSPSIISGAPNLRTLHVERCSLLEQVIGKDDENVGETILFPSLECLFLSNLPNILTFCYNTIQLPSLKELHILTCPKMLKFVAELPNNISNSTTFFNKQVYCPRLNFLCLSELNISAVFSPRTFITFTNFEILQVTCCEELEHIIIKEEGETACEELTQTVPLCLLHLIGLPKLSGSIFQMKHPLEFPSLKSIYIGGCPMLEKFSLGSVHLHELEIISSPEIHSKNNCFIISIEDISFSSDDPENIHRCLLPVSSNQSFADVVKFLDYIVGKFKSEKIQTGIEYEIMLMIMLEKWANVWKNPIELELKIPGESKLQQHTETLENQPKGIWTEISIGKFTMREPQQISEELEFSLRILGFGLPSLWVKGVRIVEV